MTSDYKRDIHNRKYSDDNPDAVDERVLDNLNSSGESPISEECKQHYERYCAACHAMQTGVAFMINAAPEREISAKSIRVGLNNAMVEHGALAGLLVEKGVITYEEYYKSLADMMEREVKMYEKILSEVYDNNVILC